MAAIILPRPGNVRGRFGAYVTNDMFHIAERLQEIDGGTGRLYIQSFDDPIEWHGRTYNFAIVEYSPELTPPEQLVMRVRELDSRVIQQVERMRQIPFAKRFAEFEKLEAKWEAEDKARQLDELYERMGEPFLRKLEECNFIDPTWARSYAKVNKTARRHRNFKGLGGAPASRVVLPAGVRA
jgi:hypothetical protein